MATLRKLGPISSLLVALCLQLSLAQIPQSPFCTQCVCMRSKDQATLDVDCTERLISHEFLYNQLTWFDGSNSVYPIGKLVLRDSDLGNLSSQFQFSNLTYLDLSKNMVRQISDSYFARLQNMKVLILSHNNLDSLKPDVFKGQQTDEDNYPLRSLTTLKLDNNWFHTLDQDLFEHIEQRLEVLDLSYNPFRVIDLQTTVAIGSITYLKELHLSFTGIKVLPEHFLHTPKYLKVLDLSGNNFNTVPTGLSESHGLEVLYFNNNHIFNLTKENGFPNISTLKVLHLCDNFELENIEEKSMCHLEHLEELHICSNVKLTNIDPGALSRVDEENEIWPPLKKLYLQQNQLTTIDSHLVLHWEKLEDLDLRYNPWKCDCENQWFVDVLMPTFVKINLTLAKELRCEEPIEMQGKTFFDEYDANKTMRCLDLYGHIPERDGTILVGVLVGLLIGIPLVLLIIFAYQRHWFGLFDSSPAAFSRQFYSRTRSDEL